MVGGVQVFVHNIVDTKEERSRLIKEMVRLDKEISLCDKKLSDERFLVRAPFSVVQQHRNRLAKYTLQKKAIERSLDELEENLPPRLEE
jgi:valyl-tRNA synthetase